MPRQTEPSANNALGAILQGMFATGEVRSENTQIVIDHPGLRPDLVVLTPGRSPVVVEAEYLPAATVEEEALSRLGRRVSPVGRLIEAAVALRYPDEVGDCDDLDAALRAARLSYAVFTEEGERFPEAGWLDGRVENLADMIRLVSLPQRAVDAAADALEQGIERAAGVLDELAVIRPGINQAIAAILGMDEVPQTWRMAGAIIANALVFHERIAGIHPGIKPLDQVCGPESPNPIAETVAAWNQILAVNYWPIFAVGQDLLRQLPARDAARLLSLLHYTVGEVERTGIDNAHDLSGRVFQRLIADRKYLATFYTLPASASLLARLAVAKLTGVDWADAGSIGRLRIADLACGTGALLSSVYEQMAARYERTGGDPARLHAPMMEEILYGCDVMPSAVHITGSTLSGAQPNVGFSRSRLYTLPYGRQSDGSVKLGSLEFLQSSAASALFNTSDPAQRTGSVGEETAAHIIVDVPDEGFDLVIMNPPFTSNTKHRDAEGKVLNAAFAAFGASVDAQDDMSTRLTRLARDSHYHGHAGLGSAFASIAHRKLRPGGVLALVLPFTAINGSSWAKFRELIATQYADVTVVSIAAAGTDMAFSSETGIAECLVVGRKTAAQETPARRAQFITLNQRPSGLAAADEFYQKIVANPAAWRLEDGPYGGTPLFCGASEIGESLDAPLDDHETGWRAARIADASIAQVAHSLAGGHLRLPAQHQSLELPVTALNQIGERGVDHQLLVSAAHNGPFLKGAASPTATYPALYNHNAQNEKYIVCNPDSSFRVKPGMEQRAGELWPTASRAHLNLDFRFTSQPLCAAFTDFRTIGGTAWPNVIFPDNRFDYPFTLWANTTLGLLLFWWYASRQQQGRGRTTIAAIETLPVLDFRALSEEQLATAEGIFDEFRELELLPAYLADADPHRALLDRRVLGELLGFDEEVYRRVRRLARKWCAEPSVHGGKPRPRRAVYVE